MAVHLPEPESQAISDLISDLKSSFFSSEFEFATQKLISREERLKNENSNLRKKIESLEKKHQDELKKKETEINELRKIKCELELKIKVSEKKFLDLNVRVLTLEKLGKELMSQKQISSSPSHSPSPAAENSKQPLVSEKAEKGDSNIKTEPKFPEIIQLDDDDDDDLECISMLKRIKVLDEKKKTYSSDDDDDDTVGTAVFKRRRVSKETKGDSNGDFSDKVPSGTQKSKNREELHSQTTPRPLSNPYSAKNKPLLEKHEPKIGTQKSEKLEVLHSQPPTSCPLSTPSSAKNKPMMEKHEPKSPVPALDSSDNLSSDEDTEKVDNAYMSLVDKLQKERWKSESHMLKDFGKDDDLCLNAMCTIKRQNITLHGSDISRANLLARILINGDPQGKLKKKASELNQEDLDYCRMCARKYVTQFFKIYQTKKDPFFPPRTSYD